MILFQNPCHREYSCQQLQWTFQSKEKPLEKAHQGEPGPIREVVGLFRGPRRALAKKNPFFIIRESVIFHKRCLSLTGISQIALSPFFCYFFGSYIRILSTLLLLQLKPSGSFLNSTLSSDSKLLGLWFIFPNFCL